MNKRLICYNVLVDVAKAMPKLIASLPRGESNIIDQLKRTLASAILNLAEGNGRYSIKERNRFFNISLGCISELEGGLDYLSAYGLIDTDLTFKLIGDLKKAYYMIRKLRK